MTTAVCWIVLTVCQAEGNAITSLAELVPVKNVEFQSDTSRVYDIDEVVVVAQPKESFRLRQQPLASTSFSQSDLCGMRTQDLRELSAYVPSFTMPAYGSRLTSSIYVRGLGSRINSPVMGIYVDGMPIQNKTAYNFHLYEIDRVDVLRGPQGTLYGMNAEGGLIRIYSKILSTIKEQTSTSPLERVFGVRSRQPITSA